MIKVTSQFSVYQLVESRVDEEMFYDYRGVLQNISYHIETAVWEKQLVTRLFAGFQKMSFFLPLVERYRELALIAEEIWIFGLPDVTPPEIEGIHYIYLDPGDALVQEWFLVVDTPDYFSALAAMDLTGFGHPHAKRKFKGIWTFEDDMVHLLQVALSIAIGRPPLKVPQRSYIPHMRQISRTVIALVNGLEKKNSQLRSSKMTSDFMGVITHEMRTPLASLAFSLQLVERDGFDDWSVEQKEEFASLKSYLNQAQRMTNNLISFATFLSKQGALILKKVSLSNLIDETLLPLYLLANRKGVQLNIEIDNAMPQMLLDREKMQDAIHHLVDNGIKFSDKGGFVHLRCWCEGEYLLFQVEDNGKGIPSDAISRIWDGFMQMSDPLLRGVEGLGLGLPLVKYVVEAHGGEVAAVSEENRGSVFEFRIPIKQGLV